MLELGLTNLPVFALFVFFSAQAAVEQPRLTNDPKKLVRDHHLDLNY